MGLVSTWEDRMAHRHQEREQERFAPPAGPAPELPPDACRECWGELHVWCGNAWGRHHVGGSVLDCPHDCHESEVLLGG